MSAMASHPFAEPKRPPDERRLCPLCSHTRSSAESRTEKVQVVWINPDGSETSFCHHCGGRGREVSVSVPARQRSPRVRRVDTSSAANRLWKQSKPIEGTPGERYFRQGRQISCPLPATLRYLPTSDRHPHLVVAAFGVAFESSPGVLQPPGNVDAVHRTFLSPDGLLRTDKRMLGPVSGKPIMLAPPNDGLGLAICEGIEDALSVHEVTGLGAWAAGSAAHLRRLAPVVPDYIECVSVTADDDSSGDRNSADLAAALRARGIEARIVRFGRYG